MSASAVVVVSSKSERAADLRAEIHGLERELSDLRPKLEAVQVKLGHLEDKRRKLEEDAARDQKPKSDTVAALLTEIAVSSLPVNPLTSAVAGKEARLSALRGELEALQREILAEKYEADQRAFVGGIITESRQCGGELTSAVTDLMQKLMRFDAIKRKLEEIAYAATLPNGRPIPGLDAELAAQARAAKAEMTAALFDGATVRVEANLLRQGYVPQYPEIVLHPMRPPRK